jgi:TolB-like protein
MRALSASGDRGAALAHVRVHEQLVRQELEADIDPSIVAYASALRDGGTDAGDREVAIENREAAMEGAATGVDAPARPEPRHQRTRRFAVAAGAAVIAALAIGAWIVAHRSQVPPRDAHSLVIVPFQITSADSSANYLSEGIVVALSSLLTGEGGLRAVNARTAIRAWERVTEGHDGTADDARRVARELGAGQALLGSLVVTGGGLTLSASVLDADGGERQELVRVTGPGSADSVLKYLDRFAVQLLGGRAGVSARTLDMLASVPLPAWRAYFDGRAAYRRAHDAEAIRAFARALEIDSTFALAGLDLAIATRKILRQAVCNNGVCRFATMASGFREATSVDDDAHFETGVRLAWQAQNRLGPRDSTLLAAIRGRNWPQPSTAREMLDDLQKAAIAAPDHPEVQYLLGVIFLHQGAALDYSDALRRAEERFLHARTLDPTYLGPLVGLVDVAAYQRDARKLRQYASAYLKQDTIGATADFVRWRVAAGTGDAAGLAAIRARFDSLESPTLNQILTASQVSGVALEDADRAAALLVARGSDLEGENALYNAHMLALNRGRPRLADSLLRERRRRDTTDQDFWNSTTLAAVFGGGSHETADGVARARAEWLASHPLGDLKPRSSVAGADRIPRALAQQALWNYYRGDTAAAAATARWLREHNGAWLSVVIEMLLATDRGTSDAAELRARVESSIRDGSGRRAPVYSKLALVRAYERAGYDSSALRLLRRGSAAYFLAASLRKEGEIALRLKDRTGALRAFEHYLALRSDPEAALVADRDSIRALVSRLRRE